MTAMSVVCLAKHRHATGPVHGITARQRDILNCCSCVSQVEMDARTTPLAFMRYFTIWSNCSHGRHSSLTQEERRVRLRDRKVSPELINVCSHCIGGV